MHEYRIKKLSPYTFEIEVKRVFTEGFLFWKKTKYQWVPIDINGDPFDFKSRLTRCCKFSSLSAAQRRVAQFTDETITNDAIEIYEV